MKKYEVRLNDGGSWFWDVEVEANSVEEACDKAFDEAEKNEDDYKVYSDDGSCAPEYIEQIVCNDKYVDVPLKYTREKYHPYVSAVDLAIEMVAKGHAEEALMALENIPGLKGLGDLVRGVR